jgi:LuxR family maltose regulon positive regulatory protein
MAVTIATVRAGIAIALGEPEKARALLKEAVSRLAQSEKAPTLSVRWNLALVDWMEGRLADAEREAAELVAEGRTSGIPHLLLSAGATLGRIQRAQGRLGDALRTYGEALELAAAAGGAAVPTTGEAHVGMAEVLYQRDQLDDALHHLTQGVELCKRLTSKQPLATGLSTLAWVRWAAGDASGAAEAMEEAFRALPSLDVVSFSNPVPAERARLLLAQGMVAEAAGWLEERRVNETDEPAYAREREYLVLARLLLARSEPHRALAVLRRLATQAEADGRAGSLIEIGALQALALSAMGDRGQALSGLVDALALGRREGYVRVFADEGRPMAGLLGALVTSARRRDPPLAQQVPAEYLDRVLRAVRRTQDQARAAPRAAAGRAAGLVEDLTDREVEVLEKLAAGKSNREIADDFVITLDTVKKHVTHIFEKLGATNRTQAVAIARKLGLIP